MSEWQRMADVPNGVTVTNRYGEFYTGSFVAYGRDIQYARREQPYAPFTERRKQRGVNVT